MNLREYKSLNEPEQYNVLWQEGILIDACIEGEVRKLLYAINNFYIELWCHISTNKIIWKLSFKQGKLLEKYLEKYSKVITKDLPGF
jgi:hypothetical protein